MDIKYTSDGKKVVIVGQLNTQETIVQEVFCKSDGAEIPSGQNFVVKSLHDEPVVSWQEERKRDIEDAYERAKAAYEREEKSLRLKYREEIMVLKSLIKKTREYQKLGDIGETITKFMAGEITHLVVDDYGRYRIQEFGSAISENDFEEIKLLTLFGGEKQGLQWRLNNYRDGSGSNTNVYPATSLDDAKQTIEGLIEAALARGKGATSRMIEAKNEYGLSIPPAEEIAKKYERDLAEVQSRIKKKLEDVEKTRMEEKELIAKASLI